METKVKTAQQTIKDQLKAAGFKMTPQRAATVVTLLDQQDQYLTAEKVFILAKARRSDIGLATVYRTLDILVNLGILQKHSLNQDGILYYRLQQAKDVQLICRKCGKVIPLDPEIATQFRTILNNNYAFKVDPGAAGLQIKGLCAQCAQDNSDEA